MGATVQTRLFGSLRTLRPPNAEAFPVEPDATIEDLLGDLRIPAGKVHLTFLNGVKVDQDALVSDGDTIGIFPPLGGG
ncbi:MAG: MoaD/ThiS family protein [Spirochaetales bacterium]|nr:MoaD/ThiS family protein [Spirochaetales bacterium]